MLGGLTRRISSLCDQVKELRADISTTSARERERLRQSRVATAHETGAGLSATSQDEECPDGRPVTQANRESSLATPRDGDGPSNDSSERAPTSAELTGVDGAEVRVASKARVAAGAIPIPSAQSDLDVALDSDCTSTSGNVSAELLHDPTVQAIHMVGQISTSAEERGNLAMAPENRDGSGSLPSTISYGAIVRSMWFDNSRSLLRAFSRLLPVKPERRHSSSPSTCG
ncbi:hypothetical protein BN946_scf184753.g36 [Trametes cinnabarina]|uniref:Uncharacterized protein n=1 Tax=Pycnoporus cinnabarinus TaxID=5643 RepID=A0A060ST34_PYCCI|nr:hypothetical protein BN946_scf184753.g36 [Trametes cinnabarina]